MNTDNHLPKDNSSVPGRTNDPETFAKFASVKSYQDYLTDKDNPVVMVTLTVNDQGFLDNTTFETYLTQHTNAHDEFTIVVSDTAIDDFYGQVMRNSKNLLGEPITIHIHHKGAVVQSFKGIIAQVSDKRNEGGGYGNLHISGYGLSILLDSGEECQSYEDKTLPEIIAEATNEYGDVKVNTKGMVNTKYKIPYVVQYKESDYQFIQRLARRYGEFFFYDGTQLQFNNETRQTVQLSEGDDLIEVAFELKIQPQHFSYLSYGVEKGEVEEKNTKNVRLQDKGNPFQFAAVKASEKVFTKKTKVPYNAFTEEFRGDYLADNVRREKESREQLMEVRGRSRNPNLRIGGFVKLKDINDKPMESYRIIDIKHHQSGYDYENEFVAIPDVYIAYYYDREALPRAEQQIARVTDNNDPKGLGRVRVQFIWQVAKKLQTPWIRVVQPHAGGGKGFYFIPEIGEEVLVDFEDQNAERPFVVGSHYNGKEYSPFHNTNNDIKAIQTRSGHKLIFTEDESILLSDKNGNTLRFDTQGKNIEISAPESISLCAGKDINLSAGNNLLMDVANVASFNILQQLLVNTPYMKQLVTELFHTQAGKALINSDDQIKIEAKETNVVGMQKLLLHSDQDAVVNSKGYLDMRGEQGNKMKNKAEGYEAQDSAPIIEDALAIVHFRPQYDWQGEFGFDWLRIDDNGYNLLDEGIYDDIIEGGYKDGISDYTGSNAFDELKKEYKKYIIKRKGAEDKEYFVPYLTLFPKDFVEEYKKNHPEIEEEYLPKYEAELDILIEIAEDIDRLEFEDNKFFEITPCELSDKRKTTLTSSNNKVTITCLQPLEESQCIRIYAYPKAEEIKDVKIRDLRRKLAGEIIVLQNDKRVRKEEKFVFVNVKTNLTNERGDIVNDLKRVEVYEKKIFRSALYQALIIPIVEEAELDLTRTSPLYSSFARDFIINNVIDINRSWKNIQRGEIVKNIEKELRKIFLFKEENKKYENYFSVFILNAPVNDITKFGRCDAIQRIINNRKETISFLKNVILFKQRIIKKDYYTLAHETFHGFGIWHIHREDNEQVIKNSKKKFIFQKHKTTNVMNYNETNQDLNSEESSVAFSSWFWQWMIINSNIKKNSKL